MATSDYFDLGTVKTYLKIKQEDVSDDEILRSFGEAGNRIVDDIMFSYSSSIPLTGDTLTSAQNIANYHTVVLYKAEKLDEQGVKIWTQMRDFAITALKDKLKNTTSQPQNQAFYKTAGNQNVIE